ncbi:MAG: large conductance mechanosensitive channel protein MscL, partial [Clostridia bacterium]|nr:large conductance mechanosensitive channel protein MscL [Clostridia bacterium]
MKKFFGEFKKFITRGNVLDMAVGVIVGGAFTAIVNGLSNFVLKPLINWFLAVLLGKDALSELFTFLRTAYTVDADGKEIIDLANSIYIDWGSLINAIINFIITAFVLFCIVRAINNLKEPKPGKITKDDKKA